MAVFTNVILLWGLLQTAFLEESQARDPEILPAVGCNCITYNQCSRTSPCYVVECQDIDNREAVLCVRKYLREVRTNNVSFVNLRLHSCDSGLFPHDLLATHPLKSLELISCNVTSQIAGLLAPVCDTLFALTIRSSQGFDKTIRENQFGECPSLGYLNLWMNNVHEVSPAGFVGLSNLERLELSFNNVTAFEGLEGIPRLKLLSMHGNGLKHVGRNAFRNLRSLKTILLGRNGLTTLEEGTFESVENDTEIFLSGNPLICDCSLKWLQDWSENRPASTWAYCGPEQIPLLITNLSYCPLAATNTGQATADSATDITVFMSVITLTMKYILKLFDA